MTHFLLVHGAFQSAAAWQGVAAGLIALGHQAQAIDLPGRNLENLPSHPLSLKDYVSCVRQAVTAIGQPVVLVGHSFGGMTISQTAEEIPEKIARLIYVAAYLPQDGDSLQALSGQDQDNKITPENFIVAPDWSHASILERDRVMLFANDAPDDLAGQIARSLLREPLAPMAEAVHLAADRYGRVPKSYIRTLRDHTISPQFQNVMIARAGAVPTFDLDAGHSASLTRTKELVDLIICAA
jgi:pimeloyl-ACP methyl ester carboxylesterase